MYDILGRARAEPLALILAPPSRIQIERRRLFVIKSEMYLVSILWKGAAK